MNVVHTPDAPAHTGPVPQAVVTGNWVFVSALFGTDPRTGARPADPRAEADQLFANLTAILASAGASAGDVVRAGIFMRHLRRDRPVFNAAWVAYFGAHRPARSAVEVTDFGRAEDDCRFMVEVVAHRPGVS
jgi:2-iminobutanoate/2-iminopropanoate deaminase